MTLDVRSLQHVIIVIVISLFSTINVKMNIHDNSLAVLGQQQFSVTNYCIEMKSLLRSYGWSSSSPCLSRLCSSSANLIPCCYSSCCCFSCSCCSCWAMLFKKGLRLHQFKSDQDEIWQYCSSGKYASIDVISHKKVLPSDE